MDITVEGARNDLHSGRYGGTVANPLHALSEILASLHHPDGRVAYVDGLENPTETFPNICGWLVQHGFDDREIQAVFGGNVYRTLQSIWIG